MTVYDSSVLIDYLDGVDGAIRYVETHADERATAPPLVLFEVYRGEVFKSGPTDLDAVNAALDWLTVTDASSELSRTVAELQDDLRKRGEPLAARDALVAGAARRLGERLVVADADFDVAGLTDLLTVDFL